MFHDDVETTPCDNALVDFLSRIMATRHDWWQLIDMTYEPNHTSMYLVYIRLDETYSLSFLCDVINKTHENMQ